jgi:L-amino acid N-acyltransferase YncA
MTRDVTIRVATASDAAAIARVYAPHVESSYAPFGEVAPSAGPLEPRAWDGTR